MAPPTRRHGPRPSSASVRPVRRGSALGDRRKHLPKPIVCKSGKVWYPPGTYDIGWLFVSPVFYL